MSNLETLISNLKTLSVIMLAITTCSIASPAFAQTSPQMLENAQPILSQPNLAVKSTEGELQIVPNTTPSQSKTYKITRVEEPVPAQASETQLKRKPTHSGVINATTSEENVKTRFIYTRSKDETAMPVFYNEESAKSR